MATTKKDNVSYVITGSNFQATEQEVGKGRTRNGIKLDLAMQLFRDRMNCSTRHEEARVLALSAFDYAECFLTALDAQKEFRRAPKPKPAPASADNGRAA